MESSDPSLAISQNPLAKSQEAGPAMNEHVVIWHDPYLYSSTKARYIKTIKMICNVQPFVDWEEALRYLKENLPVSCQVITSGNNGELLVKEIFNMDNITSIYVFDDDSQQAPLRWIKHYPKIMGAESKFTALLDKICQTIQPSLSVTSSNMTNQLNIEQEKEKEEKKEDETEEIVIMARVDEMIKLFVKECTVIWYDPKANSPEKKNKINHLKEFCDIRTFTDWEEAIKFLKETQVSFCQMIISLSGANAEPLVKEITGLKCVSWIYILTEDDVIMSNPSWMDQHRRIVQIENDFTSIANTVKEKIEKWRKKNSSLRTDLPSFAPLFDDTDRSEENYRHEYLKGLSSFENRKQAKRDLLALATALYGTKQDIREFEQDYTDYEMRSILKWYTKESFLYKLTNNCLRVANLDSIQYCRLPLRDLETAIKEKYKQQSQNFSGLLHRGAYMSETEWMRLQQNTGKDIEMHGFLSTTKNKDAAIVFCQEEQSQKVFITIIVLNGKAKDEQGFAEMKEYSDYPDEDEVLFNIRSRFTVLEAKVEQIDRSDVRHLVLLYGAQAMRLFTAFESPAIQIQIHNAQTSVCNVCRQKIRFDDDSVLGINITNSNEYTCHSCLYNHKMSKLYPLLCLKPSAYGLSNSISGSERSVNFTVKGSVMQNQECLNIEFYGYRCSICQLSKSNGWYTCLDCETGRKISYCNKCFFEEQNKKCDKMGHMIIFEGHPFSFWSEKVMEKEVHRLKYQEQRLEDDDSYCNQTRTFMNTLHYKETAELCQKYLNNKPEMTEKSSNIHRLYNNLSQAYVNLGEYQKAKHYSSLSLQICKEMFGDKHQDTALSFSGLGSVYESLGEYEKAIDYYSLSLEICKTVFGEKHTNTAALFAHLGSAYESLGEYQKAIDYYSLSLSICKTAFGDNHPHTAFVLNCLGRVFDYLSEYQKAIDYYTLSLEIHLAVFGDKHPGVATVFNNLGSCYLILGEYQKAIVYCSQSLEAFKAIFGEKHLHTASSVNSLGLAYYGLGEYQKAIDYHCLCLDIKKAVFGDNHPDTANSINNLGLAYWGLGKYQKAIDNYSLSLDIRKRAFGDNHPKIARSFNNLGAAYDALGESKKAIDYYSLSLEINKAVFGEKHSDTATSFNNLGTAHKNLGEYQKAIKYYSLSLEINKAVFGDKHPDTAILFTNLGTIYHSLGEYQQAINFYDLSLDIKKTVFGDKHPETAKLALCLGSTYQNLGKYQKAINYYSQCLDIRKTVLGDEHPDTIILFNLLGSLYYSLGKYHKARDYYSLSLEANKLVLGDQHPDTALSFNNFGAAYQKLGEYQKAIDYHSLSLQIYNTLYGNKHKDTATTFNALGLAYEKLGEYQTAIVYNSLALEIRKELFGDNHSDTATSFNDLGSVYASLGEYQKAIDYCSRSLEIRKALFGEKHTYTAASFNNLGLAYENSGEYQKAVEYHSLSLEIRKAVFGDNHTETATSLGNLGSAYSSLGEYDKAIEYLVLSHEIYTAEFGENHPDTVTVSTNLQLACEKVKDVKD